MTAQPTPAERFAEMVAEQARLREALPLCEVCRRNDGTALVRIGQVVRAVCPPCAGKPHTPNEHSKDRDTSRGVGKVGR